MADGAPAWGLCDAWITDAQLTDGCAACDTDLTHISETIRGYARTLASEVLFELTGRRWPGRCAVTEERPCGPHLTGCCECGMLRSVRLSNGPVHRDSITVTLDGEVVPDAEVGLVRDREVIFLRATANDAPRFWPCCQRLDLPLTEVGTYGIEYEYGNLPPEGSIIPTTMLARDYALACGSGGSCAACEIPDNVQNLVRQGVALTMPDPRSLLTDGFTGVGVTDAWLASLRYGVKHRRATATRPGSKQALRVQ